MSENYTFEGILSAICTHLGNDLDIDAGRIAQSLNNFTFNIQGEVKPNKKKIPERSASRSILESVEDTPSRSSSKKIMSSDDSKGSSKKASDDKSIMKKTANNKKKDVHPCERIKTGQHNPCGKNARNELKGHWYCGTEKTGCYKSALGESNREEKTKKKPIMEPAKKPNTQKIKSISHLQLREVNGYWVDPETRIVYNKKGSDNGIAYGVLKSDNETVGKLSDANKRLIETAGWEWTDEMPKNAKRENSRSSSKRIMDKKYDSEEEIEVEEEEIEEVETDDDEVEVETDEEEVEDLSD